MSDNGLKLRLPCPIRICKSVRGLEGNSVVEIELGSHRSGLKVIPVLLRTVGELYQAGKLGVGLKDPSAGLLKQCVLDRFQGMVPLHRRLLGPVAYSGNHSSEFSAVFTFGHPQEI